MTLGFWRDVAVVWLCLQAFVMLLIPLAIAYFAVRGMGWVRRRTPPLFLKAQGFSQQAYNRTQAVAGKAVEPVILAHSKSRQAEAVLDSLFRREEGEVPVERRESSPPTERVSSTGRVTVARYPDE